MNLVFEIKKRTPSALGAGGVWRLLERFAEVSGLKGLLDSGFDDDGIEDEEVVGSLLGVVFVVEFELALVGVADADREAVAATIQLDRTVEVNGRVQQPSDEWNSHLDLPEIVTQSKLAGDMAEDVAVLEMSLHLQSGIDEL